MRLKQGVSLAGLKPEMIVGLLIIKQVFEGYGAECIITSGTDGDHSHGSLHYVGYALDFRTNHIPAGQEIAIEAEMRSRLGKEFDVVLEETHFHVEYQPKRNRS